MQKSTQKKEFKIYLAGPEVFLQDPAQKGENKKAIVNSFNSEVLQDKAFQFVGLYPMDAQVNCEGKEDPATAMRIFAADVSLMDQADLIIANITRFRSPSADVGTAFEMGYMYAQQKPVFTYYNMHETYRITDYDELDSDAHTTYADKVKKFADGYLVKHATDKNQDSYTHMIEDFGLADNLMLIGAMKPNTANKTDHTPAASFWDALHEAATSLDR